MALRRRLAGITGLPQAAARARFDAAGSVGPADRRRGACGVRRLDALCRVPARGGAVAPRGAADGDAAFR